MLKKKKDKLTRTFDFTVFLLGRIYDEWVSIPRNLITEIHLRFFRHNKKANKKILAYWDFNQKLASLGDFISFLQMLNILRLEFNLNPKNKNIDLCYICDENHYNAKVLRFSKTYEFKKNFMLASVVNPHIDSTFFFRSNSEFVRFYQQNKKRYIRWPALIKGARTDKNEVMENFYKKNGFLPTLKLPIEILDKIYKFYEQNVFPALPIVLNIRKNTRKTDWNSNIPELKKFLKHYEKNKKYKFIIVCNKSEIPEEFRELSNVIFSKDHFSSLEYDYGFIESSYLSIIRSGVGVFALFSDTPFILYANCATGKSSNLTPAPGKTCAYFKKYQKVYYKSETGFLISKFEELVEYLEKNKINNTLKNKVKDAKEYNAPF